MPAQNLWLFTFSGKTLYSLIAKLRLLHSSSPMEQQKFIKGTSSGGVCINDVIMQLSCDVLPFGGVGSSGFGAYHGHHSFKTFSHQKGVLVRNLSKLDEQIQQIRYPPYTEKKLQIVRALLATNLPTIPRLGISKFSLFLLFILVATILSFSFKWWANHEA